MSDPNFVPQLLPDLKLALATLYSLPLPYHGAAYPSSSDAHEYLIDLQSRNFWRNVRALHQRYQNQSGKRQQDALSEVPGQIGSVWLACLSLISQTGGNHRVEERLFAAQTLLHRLRRMKLVEAVDLEAEQAENSDILHLYQTNDRLIQLIPTYKKMLHAMNPFCAMTLASYHSDAIHSVEDEERIKGELTLVTLAAISYLTACDPHKDGQTIPILSALGSSMAVAALRLRYSHAAMSHSDHQSPPIVSLVIHAFRMVWNAAESVSLHDQAGLGLSLNISLAAVPDALLGTPGGARGRLSIDPRCLQAALKELRMDDLALLWDAVRNHVATSSEGVIWILKTCERWAKFLPLSTVFLVHTMPIVNECLGMGQQYQQAALAYLIAIFEGGSWTVDDVRKTSLGLADQQQAQQNGKKRQSCRSKKRQTQIIESRTTERLLSEAEAEVHHRGEIACRTISMAGEALNSVFQKDLRAVENDTNIQVEGEGSIGCIAASANACLPFLIRNPSWPHAHDIFDGIAQTFQQICESRNRHVRALSFEPLYTLHSAFVDLIRTHGSLEERFETLVVEHIQKCSLNLASSCGYPTDYFDDLAAISSEDLEIERNDVRDLLRTVASSEQAGSTSHVDQLQAPLEATIGILSRLLHACGDAMSTARRQQQLFPETSIHAFSALAKPLNHLGKSFTVASCTEKNREILLLALQTLTTIGEMLEDAFLQSASPQVLLPLSRTANIAVASLSPMLSELASDGMTDPVLLEAVHRAVKISVHTCTLAIASIPELAAPSKLDHTQYDVRGTFRNPGGEDHVSCIALTRLAFESDNLAKVVVKTSIPSIIQLRQIYQQLKNLEAERGQGVFHGRGMTPKSRRMLLGVLCRLEFVSESNAGMSGALTELFDHAVEAIVSFNGQQLFDERALFALCENTFELAAFSVSRVTRLFDADSSGSVRTRCLETLTTACVQGYQSLCTSRGPDDAVFQWNRLRGALFTLIKWSAFPDIPKRAGTMVQALITAECDAIHRQCLAGPSSISSIFVEDVISIDAVPAGLFVRVVGEVLEASSSTEYVSRNCIETLHMSRKPVLSAIMEQCQDPSEGSFIDPRCSLFEAWLLTMTELVRFSGRHASETSLVEELLAETCVTAVSILFYPTMGRTYEERMHDPGMSLDGPQSLALTRFLSSYFTLGGHMLQAASLTLVMKIPIDVASISRLCGNDPGSQGVAIIGAALFRAAQGGLPPWAVESIPEVYSALFLALDKDPTRFGSTLRASMDVRLAPCTEQFGSVQPNQLLSGRFFETMTEKDKFIGQAVELSLDDNRGSWRRLKVLIKQACGGKKKDTDFRQKPPLTRWEFERI